MEDSKKVPIENKLTLTIPEAVEYSNIGQNTLYELLKLPNCPFLLRIGKKKLIKRKELDAFVSRTSYIPARS